MEISVRWFSIWIRPNTMFIVSRCVKYTHNTYTILQYLHNTYYIIFYTRRRYTGNFAIVIYFRPHYFESSASFVFRQRFDVSTNYGVKSFFKNISLSQPCLLRSGKFFSLTESPRPKYISPGLIYTQQLLLNAGLLCRNEFERTKILLDTPQTFVKIFSALLCCWNYQKIINYNIQYCDILYIEFY